KGFQGPGWDAEQQNLATVFDEGTGIIISGFCAAHLQNDIHAPAVLVPSTLEKLLSLAWRSLLIGVEAEIGSQLAGQTEPLFQHFYGEAISWTREIGDVNTCRAQGSGDRSRHQSLGSTPEYGDGPACDIGFHHGMNRIAQRVKKRSEPRGYYGPPSEPLQVYDVHSRNGDVFRKSSVHVQALNTNVLADVTLAGSALLAVAAANVHLASDIVSHLDKTRVDVDPDFDRLAAKLMSHNYRTVARYSTAPPGHHLSSHPGPLSDVVDALVGPAYGSRGDANLDLGVAHAWYRFIFNKLQPVPGEVRFLQCYHPISIKCEASTMK